MAKKTTQMEYEIKEVYEQNGNLIVIIDHAFGTDKFGFSLESKKLDPETDEPRYLTKAEKHLELKYGDTNRKKKVINSNYIGKKRVHKNINIPSE